MRPQGLVHPVFQAFGRALATSAVVIYRLLGKVTAAYEY